MNKSTDLLQELTQEEVQWVFQAGRVETYEAGAVLIEEGSDGEAIYFVIQGLLHVITRALADRPLAVLGAGEIVGELSFIDGQLASASTIVQEDSKVLILPWDTLDTKLGVDTQFAAHWYRALAIISACRLRATIGQVGIGTDAAVGHAGEHNPVWQEIKTVLERLKHGIVETDKAAIKAGGRIPEDLLTAFQKEFGEFVVILNNTIGEEIKESEVLKRQIGQMVLRELLPYVLMSRTAERSYSKPRGYAGDFYSIEYIYKNEAEGSGRIGPLLDRCFLDTPSAMAIRNRRAILSEEILKTVDQAQGKVAHIVSIGCGPAKEVFDVYESLPDPSVLRSTLIDMDVQALSFVSQDQERFGLSRYIELVMENIVHVADGWYSNVELSEQDLVYSIGLMDYFNDPTVIKIIDYVHSILKPGGRIVLGNFHPRNPSRALMDHVLEWLLIHRTEGDMDSLFERSKFGRPCTSIRFEPEQINLFAECIKE